jgi:hypothetical protein
VKHGQDTLAVRRYNRRECDLGCWIRVGDLHSAQVVFSRAVCEGEGLIRARIVDCSEGGLGVRTGVYLPRGLSLVVGFSLPAPDGPTEHELELRVQRSSMIDPGPTYYLGTSTTARAGSAATMSELLAWAAALAAPPGEAA